MCIWTCCCRRCWIHRSLGRPFLPLALAHSACSSMYSGPSLAPSPCRLDEDKCDRVCTSCALLLSRIHTKQARCCGGSSRTNTSIFLPLRSLRHLGVHSFHQAFNTSNITTFGSCCPLPVPLVCAAEDCAAIDNCLVRSIGYYDVNDCDGAGSYAQPARE